jgi:hypothetical protein
MVQGSKLDVIGPKSLGLLNSYYHAMKETEVARETSFFKTRNIAN